MSKDHLFTTGPENRLDGLLLGMPEHDALPMTDHLPVLANPDNEAVTAGAMQEDGLAAWFRDRVLSSP